MYCPFCKAIETKVIDSRLSEEGVQVRRRRECVSCRLRFTTYEEAQVALPRVVKRDGSRVAFSDNKLRSGMLLALEKRPVSTAVVDSAIRRMTMQLAAAAEQEVTTAEIGEMVMAALHALDHVAYVRFASVYRAFEDVDAFHKVLREVEEGVS